MRILISALIIAVAVTDPLPAISQSAVSEEGIHPWDNYISTSIDSVNTSNGNLVVHIPLISYKQRGTLPDFSLFVRYNNKSWSMGTFLYQEDDPNSIYYAWVFNGYGAQIARGNTLLFKTITYPDATVSPNNVPEDEYLLTVDDSTGASHALYAPAADPTALRTMDGSGIWFSNNDYTVLDNRGIKHTTVYDSGANNGFGDQWTDANRNSVIPHFNSSLYQIDYWTDSVGRTIPSPGNDTFEPTPGCNTVYFPSAAGGQAPYTFCYQQYSVQSAFGSQETQEGTAIPVMLSSVTLPNGTSYTFTYNSWGDLTTISLPTGGAISYQWTSIEVPNYYPPVFERVIQSRTVSDDRGGSETWTYEYNGLSTSVTDPNDNLSTYPYGELGPGTSSNPICTQEMHYQGPSTISPLLSSTSRCYYDNGGMYSFAGEDAEPANLLSETTNTLYGTGGSVTTATSYTYDPPTTMNSASQCCDGYELPSMSLSMGIPLSTSVYDYGAGSSPGTQLQTTTTQYEWQGNSSYYTANLLTLPCVVTEYGPGSVPQESGCTSPANQANQLSQTGYGYDENNGSPQGTLGNLTSVSQWVNTSGTSIKSTAVYNSYGMKTDTYDANSNAGISGDHVQIGYDSTGLFPSTITHGAHKAYYAYDSNTGNLSSYTDENGTELNDPNHTTTYLYDNMGRITSVSYPDGGSSSYCYTDVGGSICSAGSAPFSMYTSISATPDPTQISHTQFDGLGQPVEVVYPNGAKVNTWYDFMGNPISVKSPYFSPSHAYSTFYEYDANGRKTDQWDSDGTSSQSWNYSGNTATHTDEDGNVWTQTLSALGKVTKVLEPDGTAEVGKAPTLETDYQYDGLGNLMRVDQWGGPNGGSGDRIRTFTYDSLSRLLCASNPEASNLQNPAASCPTTASATYTPGTVGYGYDPNGNVISKTDTKGIITTYGYDGLNRLVSKTYSGNVPAGSLSSCYQYDTASNGTGLLGFEWTQAGNCPSTMPTTPLNSGYQSQRVVSAYDPMGRIKSEQQCIALPNAQGYCTPTSANAGALNYSYDLAGAKTTYSNGVDPTILQVQPIPFSQQFDSAGHLASVSIPNTPSTPWVSPPQLPVNLFTANSSDGYTASGALQDWTFGANLNVTRSYDNRLRITSETATRP